MILPDLPERPLDAHKGTFGHVLVVAGSTIYSGAAVLAARAVLRGGAGMVTLACPAGAHAMIAARLLCEMAVPLPDDGNGALHQDTSSTVLALAEERDVVALGPGLTRHPGAAALARTVAMKCPRPLVLDADGLNAFEGAAETLREAAGPRVLTPHAGEAARLLGEPVETVAADRSGAALRLAALTGGVVLIKGDPTFVAEGDDIHASTTGNSGMATAGCGDVLTGLVAALLAQGMTPGEAALLGAHLHGRAGDLAARAVGQHGMIASDVLDRLPAAIRTHADRT